MNASCALQHFCDIHGPQILLCTEGRTYIHDLNDNDNEEIKTFYSQYNKAENPQEKNRCKVKKSVKITKLTFDLVMYIIIRWYSCFIS
jgi:hypothetical protein